MSEAQPFSAEIIGSITEIDATEWDACTDGNPFLKHAFLLALEASGCASLETGWQPYHIRLMDHQGGSAVGFLPCYLKSHSFGEYVFDHAWAHAYEHAGGAYYPKLQSSVPFTPVTCPRLLTVPGTREEAKAGLLQAIISATDQLGLSSAHMTFLNQSDASLAEKSGYLLRIDQQFHWQNNNYKSFEAFLETLSSRKRKQIKKERRTALAKNIQIEQLHGKDITETHLDQFFIFYEDTGTRKWGQPYLTREFFTHIHQSMPENIVLFMCRKDDNYVAGAINFIGPETLYGRYWGCTEEHPCLHFETCYYQAIDYAITHGLKTVEAGAQGPHKIARGYSPVRTYSAHWIPDPKFREALEKFLLVEGQDVDAEISYLTARAPFKKV